VLSKYGTTNKQILLIDDFGNVNPDRFDLVKQIVRIRFDDVVSGKLIADDLNVFIKAEPITHKKFRENRDRLISAVSLVDTLVDRILFGWLQRKQRSSIGKTPCMFGWTPAYGGWKDLRAHFCGNPVLCLDKSSWDWTVQGHLVDFWYSFLTGLAIDAPLWWQRAVGVRLTMLFDKAVFRFKCGLRVPQVGRGIMKSGCFLTLTLNSVSQSYLHFLAALRVGEDPVSTQPICMGDDTVQLEVLSPRAYVVAMESFGCIIKGLKVRNYIEFCGLSIGRTCRPAYWKKYLFLLQYGDVEDRLDFFQRYFANVPEMRHFFQALAGIHAPGKQLSTNELLRYMNGEDYTIVESFREDW
jgi:hypothetical protein